MSDTAQRKASAKPALMMTFLLGALGMFSPFAIDAMFPAFTQMQESLDVDLVALQQTISVYLFGLGGMSLFHGPLSDALGRRPVLFAGIAVFIVASICAALAPTLEVLLICRLIQGMSAGAGMIISRTVVRDLYSGAAAQRLMSQVTIVFSIAPALAPIMGGWMLTWTAWQGIFWFLAVMGVVLFVWVAVGLPETHPKEARSPLSVRAILGSLVRLSLDVPYMRLALAASANFGAMFLYISSAHTVVEKQLGLGEQDYWVLFVPLIGSLTLGSFLAGRLADTFSGTAMATVGFILCGLGATISVTYTMSVSDVALPWLMIGPCITVLGTALAFPVLTLALLDMQPGHRGAAASVQSFVSLMLNAVIAGALAPAVAGAPVHLALAAAACIVVGILLWVWHLSTAHRTIRVPIEPGAFEPVEEL